MHRLAALILACIALDMHAGELQAPRIFDLPADREALLKPNAVARHAHIGSPYAFIRALLTEELDSNPAAHLYVTGHR